MFISIKNYFRKFLYLSRGIAADFRKCDESVLDRSVDKIEESFHLYSLWNKTHISIHESFLGYLFKLCNS